MTLHPSLPRAAVLFSNTLSCCPLKDTPLWQTICPDFWIQKSHLFDNNILIALDLNTGAHGHCSQDGRTTTLWLHTVGPGLLSFSLAACLEGSQVLRIPDIDLLGKRACPVWPPITWASPSLPPPCPHWLVWPLGPSHSPCSLSFHLCSCHLLRSPLCRPEAYPSVKVWFKFLPAVLPSQKRMFASDKQPYSVRTRWVLRDHTV